jgi:DNA polymerase-3 subunit alpha
MGTKAALRDVARVMDIPLPEVDRVAKLVPFVSGRQTTMEDALAIPEFKEIYDSQPHLRELIDTATKGRHRSHRRDACRGRGDL